VAKSPLQPEINRRYQVLLPHSHSLSRYMGLLRISPSTIAGFTTVTLRVQFTEFPAIIMNNLPRLFQDRYQVPFFHNCHIFRNIYITRKRILCLGNDNTTTPSSEFKGFLLALRIFTANSRFFSTGTKKNHFPQLFPVFQDGCQLSSCTNIK